MECRFVINTSGMTAKLERIADELEASGRASAFYQTWGNLLEAGAEVVEVVTAKNQLKVRLSEDFRQHCAAFGVKV